MAGGSRSSWVVFYWLDLSLLRSASGHLCWEKYPGWSQRERGQRLMSRMGWNMTVRVELEAAIGAVFLPKWLLLKGV